MSGWLDNQEREYVYSCPVCGEFTVSMVSKHPDYTDPRPCDCGAEVTYVNFLPIQINIRGRVAFDQNGVKGYQVTDGKGGVRYISATRDNYQQTGNIVPNYTKEYSEHLQKTGRGDMLKSTSYETLVEERKKNAEIKKRVGSAKQANAQVDKAGEV